MTTIHRSNALPWLAAATAAAAMIAGCAAPVPRDANGVPATVRLEPNSIPPAPLTDEERQKLSELNREVLREQAMSISNQQQAEAAWARGYGYPTTNWSLFYGGWGGGHWGGGVGVSSPGWGWGGYPYWY